MLANVDGALDEGDELPGSFRERGARMLKGEAFAIAVELSLATQRQELGDILDDVLSLDAGDAQPKPPSLLDAHQTGFEVNKALQGIVTRDRLVDLQMPSGLLERDAGRGLRRANRHVPGEARRRLEIDEGDGGDVLAHAGIGQRGGAGAGIVDDLALIFVDGKLDVIARAPVSSALDLGAQARDGLFAGVVTAATVENRVISSGDVAGTAQHARLAVPDDVSLLEHFHPSPS